MSDDKPSDCHLLDVFDEVVEEINSLPKASERVDLARKLHKIREPIRKLLDAQQPAGESAEPFAYAYRTRSSGKKWLFSETPWTAAGYFCQDNVVEARNLFDHPPARSDEPSAEHWRKATGEWCDRNLDVPNGAMIEISERANELAKEGK